MKDTEIISSSFGNVVFSTSKRDRKLILYCRIFVVSNIIVVFSFIFVCYKKVARLVLTIILYNFTVLLANILYRFCVLIFYYM